jgi:ubiquinone biosynthesis protein COQ4
MDMTTTKARRTGFYIHEAAEAVQVLLRDPDDTAQVFRVIDALPGWAPERNLRRFARTELGKRVLGEGRSLLPRLADREGLMRLPAGSLGRAYLEFLDSENITAAGLVEASVTGREGQAPSSVDHEVFSAWLRDSHDVWHVVTGYQGDLIGEGALLAFSFAQTKHPGVGFIVAAGLWRIGQLRRRARAQGELDASERDERLVILEGFARGVRASWLPAVDWEVLLAEPLDDVRKRLGLGAPPRYTPVRTRDLEPGYLAAS